MLALRETSVDLAKPPLLYVSECDNNRIQVFNALSGEHVRFIGTEGREAGQLYKPFGLAVWESAPGTGLPVMLVVADAGNQRVQVFDADSGEHIRFVGVSAGETGGKLKMPGCVSVQRGSNGSTLLFVTDGADGCIRIYSL